MAGENPLSLPEDLAAHVQQLSASELSSFQNDVTTEFDTLNMSTDTDATGLSRMRALATAIKECRAEAKTREATKASLAAEVAEGAESVTTAKDDDKSDKNDKDDKDDEKEAVTAAARPQGGARVEDVRGPGTRKLNPSLQDVQRHAPQNLGPREEPVLVASADIQGFTQGGRLNGMEDLVRAMQVRAKHLPVTRAGFDAPRIPIATMQRNFTFNLGPDATAEAMNEVLTAATDPARLLNNLEGPGLLAAGGWCSPSEISYDFYNIVCEDGLYDLPTVGINRGGIRYPVSPSYGDVVAALGGTLWSWTETQDIAAVTGTAQSGTKTCGRVPCASFEEKRLDCDGLCLTVGNLTEDAWPELIANHTRLVMAAHAHKMNAKRLTQVAALATVVPSVTGTAFSTTLAGVVAPLVGAISLAAIDYRDKYAMCDGAVLEVVLPRWVRAVMRSDLRKRTGVDLLEVADARLMRMLDAEGVRVQWVNDWQVRGTGFPGNTLALTAWPSSVSFMIYAPGTVFLGQGLTLDLGIQRDSVLNATNDHTAEWMEECWLIGKPGHEIRLYTVAICPNGMTGQAGLTACNV